MSTELDRKIEMCYTAQRKHIRREILFHFNPISSQELEEGVEDGYR